MYAQFKVGMHQDNFCFHAHKNNYYLSSATTIVAVYGKHVGVQNYYRIYSNKKFTTMHSGDGFFELVLTFLKCFTGIQNDGVFAKLREVL